VDRTEFATKSKCEAVAVAAWQQTPEKALGNKVNVAPRTGPQQHTEGGWLAGKCHQIDNRWDSQGTAQSQLSVTPFLVLCGLHTLLYNETGFFPPHPHPHATLPKWKATIVTVRVGAVLLGQNLSKPASVLSIGHLIQLFLQRADATDGQQQQTPFGWKLFTRFTWFLLVCLPPSSVSFPILSLSMHWGWTHTWRCTRVIKNDSPQTRTANTPSPSSSSPSPPPPSSIQHSASRIHRQLNRQKAVRNYELEVYFILKHRSWNTLPNTFTSLLNLNSSSWQNISC